MKRPYYLFSNGRLRRNQNTLLLERKGDERQPGDEPGDEGLPTADPSGEKVPFPVERAESIYCFGEIDINGKLVTFLSQHHIPVHFFDYYGNYRATIYPKEYLLSGRLTVQQVKHYLDESARLRIARAMVDAATYNLRRVLTYYRSRREGSAAEDLEETCAVIEAEREKIEAAQDISELMGIEGRVRDRYYRTWPAILGELTDEFTITKRERQPPGNEVNALISFGNSLCYAVTLRQIYRTALDPTISYLHEPGDRRFSLSLDLSEIFKPILVDRTIFRLLNTKSLQPDDFETRMGGMFLTESGRKTFVESWDDRLQQTIEHRDLDRKVSYERLIRMEGYRLIRHLYEPEEEPYDGFKMWW